MKALRVNAVSDKTGLAAKTIWQLSASGSFPKPFKLTPAVTVWDEEDVDKWLKSKKEMCYETV